MMTTPPDIGYDDRDFKVVAIGQARPIAGIVEHLESLLARAKLGEIRGLSGMAQLLDESHEHFMVGRREPIRLIGELHRLIHRVQIDADHQMLDADPAQGG